MTSNLQVDNWHHLAFTFSQGDVNVLNIFLDGIKIKSETVTLPDLTKTDISLGNDMNGKIDNVKMYNKLLNNDEIKYLSTIENNYNYNSEKKLDLKFNEHTRTIDELYNDVSTSNKRIKIEHNDNNPKYTQGLSSYDTSLTFSNLSVPIDIPNSDVTVNSSKMSISAWVNMDTLTNSDEQEIITKNDVFSLYVKNNTINLKIGDTDVPFTIVEDTDLNIDEFVSYRNANIDASSNVTLDEPITSEQISIVANLSETISGDKKILEFLNTTVLDSSEYSVMDVSIGESNLNLNVNELPTIKTFKRFSETNHTIYGTSGYTNILGESLITKQTILEFTAQLNSSLQEFTPISIEFETPYMMYTPNRMKIYGVNTGSTEEELVSKNIIFNPSTFKHKINLQESDQKFAGIKMVFEIDSRTFRGKVYNKIIKLSNINVNGYLYETIINIPTNIVADVSSLVGNDVYTLIAKEVNIELPATKFDIKTLNVIDKDNSPVTFDENKLIKVNDESIGFTNNLTFTMLTKFNKNESYNYYVGSDDTLEKTNIIDENDNVIALNTTHDVDSAIYDDFNRSGVDINWNKLGTLSFSTLPRSTHSYVYPPSGSPSYHINYIYNNYEQQTVYDGGLVANSSVSGMYINIHKGFNKFSFEYDFKYLSSLESGIMTTVGNGDYVYMMIEKIDSVVQLKLKYFKTASTDISTGTADREATYQIKSSTSTIITENTWANIKISCLGPQINVYLNDELIIELTGIVLDSGYSFSTLTFFGNPANSYSGTANGVIVKNPKIYEVSTEYKKFLDKGFTNTFHEFRQYTNGVLMGKPSQYHEQIDKELDEYTSGIKVRGISVVRSNHSDNWDHAKYHNNIYVQVKNTDTNEIVAFKYMRNYHTSTSETDSSFNAELSNNCEDIILTFKPSKYNKLTIYCYDYVFYHPGWSITDAKLYIEYIMSMRWTVSNSTALLNNDNSVCWYTDINGSFESKVMQLTGTKLVDLYIPKSTIVKTIEVVSDLTDFNGKVKVEILKNGVYQPSIYDFSTKKYSLIERGISVSAGADDNTIKIYPFVNGNTSPPVQEPDKISSSSIYNMCMLLYGNGLSEYSNYEFNYNGSWSKYLNYGSLASERKLEITLENGDKVYGRTDHPHHYYYKYEENYSTQINHPGNMFGPLKSIGKDIDSVINLKNLSSSDSNYTKTLVGFSAVNNSFIYEFKEYKILSKIKYSSIINSDSTIPDRLGNSQATIEIYYFNGVEFLPCTTTEGKVLSSDGNVKLFESSEIASGIGQKEFSIKQIKVKQLLFILRNTNNLSCGIDRMEFYGFEELSGVITDNSALTKNMNINWIGESKVETNTYKNNSDLPVIPSSYIVYLNNIEKGIYFNTSDNVVSVSKSPKELSNFVFKVSLGAPSTNIEFNMYELDFYSDLSAIDSHDISKSIQYNGSDINVLTTAYNSSFSQINLLTKYIVDDEIVTVDKINNTSSPFTHGYVRLMVNTGADVDIMNVTLDVVPEFFDVYVDNEFISSNFPNGIAQKVDIQSGSGQWASWHYNYESTDGDGNYIYGLSTKGQYGYTASHDLKYVPATKTWTSGGSATYQFVHEGGVIKLYLESSDMPGSYSGTVFLGNFVDPYETLGTIGGGSDFKVHINDTLVSYTKYSLLIVPDDYDSNDTGTTKPTIYNYATGVTNDVEHGVVSGNKSGYCKLRLKKVGSYSQTLTVPHQVILEYDGLDKLSFKTVDSSGNKINFSWNAFLVHRNYKNTYKSVQVKKISNKAEDSFEITEPGEYSIFSGLQTQTHGFYQSNTIKILYTPYNITKEIVLGQRGTGYVINSNGEVYSWVSHESYRTDSYAHLKRHGNYEEFHIPGLIQNEIGKKFKKVITSRSTQYPAVTLISTDGTPYSFGYNNTYMFGANSTNNTTYGKFFKSPIISGKFTGGDLGYSSQALISEDGYLITTGSMDNGIRGDSYRVSVDYQNSKVFGSYFDNKKIIKVVKHANSYGIVLTDDGNLYSWGQNSSHGSLGLNDTTNRSSPVKINEKYFNYSKVIDVVTYHHCTLALTEEGLVYGWGYGYYRVHGQGYYSNGEWILTSSDYHYPSNIPSINFNNKKVKKIFLSNDKAFVINDVNEVFYWGSHQMRFMDSSVPILTKIMKLNISDHFALDLIVESIAISAYASYIVGKNDEIYEWDVYDSGSATYSSPTLKSTGGSKFENIFTSTTKCTLTDVSCVVNNKQVTINVSGSNISSGWGGRILKGEEHLQYIEFTSLESITIDVDFIGNYKVEVYGNDYLDNHLGTSPDVLSALFTITDPVNYSISYDNFNSIIVNVSTQNYVVQVNKDTTLFKQILSDELKTRNIITINETGTYDVSIYNSSNLDSQLETKTFVINSINNPISKLIAGTTVMLLQNNLLYSMKNSHYGADGRNETSDTPFTELHLTAQPQLDDGEYVKNIFQGYYRVFLVTNKNNVYGMGLNYQNTTNRYAINSISQNYYTSWGKVDTRYISGNIIDIQAGYYGTFILTDDGQLYSWGTSYNLIGDSNIYTPSIYKRSEYFNNKKVRKISITYTHVVIVTEDDSVYTWGDGGIGELGTGNTNATSSPQKVNIISGEVLDVFSGYHSTYIIMKNGDVYYAGYGYYYIFGNGSRTNYNTFQLMDRTLFKPTMADDEKPIKIIHVESNAVPVLLLTNKSNVYMFGDETHSTSEFTLSTEDTRYPCLIDPKLFNNEAIRDIESAGTNGQYVITKSGKIFSWGVYNGKVNYNGVNVLQLYDKDISLTDIEDSSVETLTYNTSISGNNVFSFAVTGKNINNGITISLKHNTNEYILNNYEIIDGKYYISYKADSNNTNTLITDTDFNLILTKVGTYILEVKGSDDVIKSTTITVENSSSTLQYDTFDIIKLKFGAAENIQITYNDATEPLKSITNMKGAFFYKVANQGKYSFKITSGSEIVTKDIIIDYSPVSNNTELKPTTFNAVLKTHDSKLYSWGTTNTYYSGHNSSDYKTKNLVDTSNFETGEFVKTIFESSFAYRGLFVLTNMNNLYRFGDQHYRELGGSSNRLFFYKLEKYELPPTIDGSKIIELHQAAGMTVVLLSNGTVFSMGYGSYTYNGQPTTGVLHQVNPSYFNYEKITKVIGGGSSCAWGITENNNVYAWGHNHQILGINYYGQSSTNNSSPFNIYQPKSTFDSNIIKVAPQHNYTIFLTNSGSLYGTGYHNSTYRNYSGGGSYHPYPLNHPSCLSILYASFTKKIDLSSDDNLDVDKYYDILDKSATIIPSDIDTISTHTVNGVSYTGTKLPHMFKLSPEYHPQMFYYTLAFDFIVEPGTELSDDYKVLYESYYIKSEDQSGYKYTNDTTSFLIEVKKGKLRWTFDDDVVQGKNVNFNIDSPNTVYIQMYQNYYLYIKVNGESVISYSMSSKYINHKIHTLLGKYNPSSPSTITTTNSLTNVIIKDFVIYHGNHSYDFAVDSVKNNDVNIKFTDIVSANYYSLALAYNPNTQLEELFSWGIPYNGRVSGDPLNIDKIDSKYYDGKKIVKLLGGGNEHLMFQTDDGCIYGYGNNYYRRLSTNLGDYIMVPTILYTPDDLSFETKTQITAISVTDSLNENKEKNIKVNVTGTNIDTVGYVIAIYKGDTFVQSTDIIFTNEITITLDPVIAYDDVIQVRAYSLNNSISNVSTTFTLAKKLIATLSGIESSSVNYLITSNYDYGTGNLSYKTKLDLSSSFGTDTSLSTNILNVTSQGVYKIFDKNDATIFDEIIVGYVNNPSTYVIDMTDMLYNFDGKVYSLNGDSINISAVDGKIVRTIHDNNELFFITDSNVVYAIGYNYYGKYGNGTQSYSTTSAYYMNDYSSITGFQSIINLYSNSSYVIYHELQTDSGIKLYAAGYGGQGQLGNDSGSNSYSLVEVKYMDASTPVATGNSGMKLLSVGSNHTIVVTGSTIKTFGYNGYYDLGRSYSSPTTSTGYNAQPIDTSRASGINSNIVKVYASNSYSSFVLTTDAIYSWGYNIYGQLGRTINYDSSTAKYDNIVAGKMDQKDVNGTLEAFTLDSGETFVNMAFAYNKGIVLTNKGNLYVWGQINRTELPFTGYNINGSSQNHPAQVDTQGLKFIDLIYNSSTYELYFIDEINDIYSFTNGLFKSINKNIKLMLHSSVEDFETTITDDTLTVSSISGENVSIGWTGVIYKNDVKHAIINNNNNSFNITEVASYKIDVYGTDEVIKSKDIEYTEIITGLTLSLVNGNLKIFGIGNNTKIVDWKEKLTFKNGSSDISPSLSKSNDIVTVDLSSISITDGSVITIEYDSTITSTIVYNNVTYDPSNYELKLIRVDKDNVKVSYDGDYTNIKLYDSFTSSYADISNESNHAISSSVVSLYYATFRHNNIDYIKSNHISVTNANYIKSTELLHVDNFDKDNELYTYPRVFINDAASFVIDDKFNLYAWGDTDKSRIGNRNDSNNHYAKLLLQNCIDVVSIKYRATYMLTRDGEIYITGRDTILTTGFTSQVPTKMDIDFFKKNKMISIKYSTNNSDEELYFLSIEGHVYKISMKNNEFKRVTFNDSDDTGEVDYFIRYLYEMNNSIYAIDTDGNLWVWGYNYYGQFGLGNNTTLDNPVKVKNYYEWTDTIEESNKKVLKDNVKFKKVIASTYVMCALSEDGNMYMSGYGYYNYNSGMFNKGSNVLLKYDNINFNSLIENIYCGNTVFYLRKNDGKLYAWGDNSYQRAGLQYTTSTGSTSYWVTEPTEPKHNGTDYSWDPSNNAPVDIIQFNNYSLGVFKSGLEYHVRTVGYNHNYDYNLGHKEFIDTYSGLSRRVLGSSSEVFNLSVSNDDKSKISSITLSTEGPYVNVNLTVSNVDKGVYFYLKDSTDKIYQGHMVFTNSFSVRVDNADTYIVYVMGTDFTEFNDSINVTDSNLISIEGSNMIINSGMSNTLTYDVNSVSYSRYLELHKTNLQLNTNDIITNIKVGDNSLENIESKGNIYDMDDICDIKTSGSSFTIYLSKTGELYSCGSNDYAQLGRSTINQNNLFLNKVNSPEKIIKFDIGQYHGLAIGISGKLYGWGKSLYGELGFHSHTYASVGLIEVFNDELNDEVAVDVVCTSYNSYILTDKGNLYSAGHGQTQTINNYNSAKLYKYPLSYFNGYPVERIFNQKQTNVFVVTNTNKELFMWGYNSYNRLLIRETGYYSKPVMVNKEMVTNNFKSTDNIKTICITSEFGMLLTYEGDMFAWGYNGNYNAIGFGRYTNPHHIGSAIGDQLYYPIVKINYVQGNNYHLPKIKNFYSTTYITAAVTTQGKLYTWGYNGSSVLSHPNVSGSPSTANYPTLIEYGNFEGVKFDKIHVNSSNAIVVLTEEGYPYGSGYGYDGALGNSNSGGYGNSSNSMGYFKVSHNGDQFKVANNSQLTDVTDATITTTINQNKASITVGNFSFNEGYYVNIKNNSGVIIKKYGKIYRETFNYYATVNGTYKVELNGTDNKSTKSEDFSISSIPANIVELVHDKYNTLKLHDNGIPGDYHMMKKISATHVFSVTNSSASGLFLSNMENDTPKNIKTNEGLTFNIKFKLTSVGLTQLANNTTEKYTLFQTDSYDSSKETFVVYIELGKGICKLYIDMYKYYDFNYNTNIQSLSDNILLSTNDMLLDKDINLSIVMRNYKPEVILNDTTYKFDFKSSNRSSSYNYQYLYDFSNFDNVDGSQSIILLENKDTNTFSGDLFSIATINSVKVYNQNITLSSITSETVDTVYELIDVYSNNYKLLAGGTYVYGNAVNKTELTIANKDIKKLHMSKIQNESGVTVYMTNDGRVFTTGETTYGKLGRDNVNNNSYFLNEIVIPNKEKAVDIECGYYYNLIVTNKNNIYGWGRGTAGELGSVSFWSTNNYPLQIDTTILKNKNIVSIHTGDYEWYILTDDNKVYSMNKGLLKLFDADIYDNTTNTVIENFSNYSIVRMFDGYNMFFAITTEGTILTWGSGQSNNYVKHEFFSISDSTEWNKDKVYIMSKNKLDIHFGGTNNISKIVGSDKSIYVLTNDGKLFSWGYSDYNQLGYSRYLSYYKPTLYEFDERIKDIKGNSYYTTAITEKGIIYTWGWTSNSFLSHSKSNSSVSSSFHNNYIEYYNDYSIAKNTTELEFNSACVGRNAVGFVLDKYGNPYAWGYGGSGENSQTFNGTTGANSSFMYMRIENNGSQFIENKNSDLTHSIISSASVVKTENIITVNIEGTNITEIGYNYELIKVPDSGDPILKYYDRGNSNSFELSIKEEGTYRVKVIAINNATDITTDNIIIIASDIPTITTGTTTYNVKGDTGTRIGAAINSDGELFTWGYSTYLGRYGFTTAADKVVFNNNVKVIDVTCSYDYYVAITDEATDNAYIWGLPDAVSLYNDSSTIPYYPSKIKGYTGDKKFVACMSGQYFTMLLTDDNKIITFGKNESGQLGNGSTASDSAYHAGFNTITPAAIVSKICARGYQSGYLTNGHDLYMCGKNNYGQLGLGDTTNRSSYTKVNYMNKNNTDVAILNEAIGDIKDFSISTYNTSILLDTGDVYACGYNYYGNLGEQSASRTNRSIFGKVAPNDVGIDGMKAIQVISYYYNSIALMENKRLYTWGYNGYNIRGSSGHYYEYTPTYQDHWNNPNDIAALIGGSATSAMIVDKLGYLYITGTYETGYAGTSSTTTTSSGSGENVYPVYRHIDEAPSDSSTYKEQLKLF
tara:strand:+ start:8827 stop:28752 length:19926 start_codon:yes stop_codon:yes gene_type:complete